MLRVADPPSAFLTRGLRILTRKRRIAARGAHKQMIGRGAGQGGLGG
ncbi:MAG: hypothetical protein K0S81_934 [Rhodospirillales bacterium]|nr:hypothetical protein [Rhodospirillales bacterium]